ncbi:MAG: MFS transporter [Pseudomonadota bacterium]
MTSPVTKNDLSPWKEILSGAVIVSALGYFVDIYDLILFSIVRVKSLTELGLSGDALLEKGVVLLNSQMFGMLLGGIIWGIMGDKLGRVKVLFGSILLYSIANLLNAFVTTVDQYALLRFVAGIGLAGELGAAITLVSESLSVKGRGHGATIVAAIGVSGAVFAGLVANLLSWRMAYAVGGLLGLSLLVLRMKTFESKMFEKSAQSAQVPMGQFLSLFAKRERFSRYIKAILIGVPLWFGVGILVTFSPEIAAQLGVTGPISAGSAVMAMYGGLAIGDLASGLLSQKLKSRKKAAGIFMFFALICSLLLSVAHGASPSLVYGIIFAMGLGMGYWAVFMMIATEQFGTNLRATVTTTVPNFVRGSVVLLTLGFTSLKTLFGTLPAAQIVGAICFSLSFWAIGSIRETYGDDLDYLEK